VRELTWRQALQLRLQRHHLGTPASDVVAVARRVCELHAQVGSAAELIAGVRSGAPPQAVRDALWRDRSLVKVWTVRGTLHLVAAEDLDR
jgi:Winged helix DNA-binding domain